MGEALVGRVGVVTGGASGNGFACAKRFVAEGARVVLGDRNEALLASAVEELGGAALGEVVDVTVEADVERLVGRAVSELGGLDLAVNSAGLGTLAPVAAHPLEEWNTVIGICLTGTVRSV
jgi:3-oxoacyl-[acyl-carrier protein] reductase